MAETAGTINWNLNLDDSQFKSALNNSKNAASGFGSHVGGVLKDVGIAAVAMGAAASAAFVGFAAISIREASRFDDVLTGLRAGLKNTGENVNAVTDALVKQAQALQLTTKFSDDQIISADAMLTTFKLSGSTIEQLNPALLDMAEGMRDVNGQTIGLDEGARLIGKVMGNAAGGIEGLSTALRRNGVIMTDAQKQIFTTGTEAQRASTLLEILSFNFGGRATAAGKTFSGQVSILQHGIADLEKTFGNALLQQITPFITKLAQWSASDAGKQTIEALIVAFQQFAGVVGGIIATVWPVLISAFQSAYNWIIYNRDAFQFVYNVLVSAFRPIILNLLELWNKHHQAIMQIVAVLTISLGAALLATVVIIAKVIEVAVKLVNAFFNIANTASNIAKAVVNSFKGMVNGVIGAINTLIRAFNSLPKQIRIGATIPQVPYFASGVQNFSGGLAVVGERGPELVSLPAGSSVIPNNSITTNIHGPINIGSEVQADSFLKRLSRNQELAEMGLATIGSTR